MKVAGVIGLNPLSSYRVPALATDFAHLGDPADQARQMIDQVIPASLEVDEIDETALATSCGGTRPAVFNEPERHRRRSRAAGAATPDVMHAQRDRCRLPARGRPSTPISPVGVKPNYRGDVLTQV